MKLFIAHFFITGLLLVNTLAAMHTNKPWRQATNQPKKLSFASPSITFAIHLKNGNLLDAFVMVNRGELDKDINFGFKTIYNQTPLILAIKHRAKPKHELCDMIVKALLGRPGIDINKPDEYGSTPLMYAALTPGGGYIFNLLLDRPEIKINEKTKDEDNDGDLTLVSVMNGTCNGFIDKKMLISFVADPRIKIAQEDLQTLINYAIALDLEYIEQLLIDKLFY